MNREERSAHLRVLLACLLSTLGAVAGLVPAAAPAQGRDVVAIKFLGTTVDSPAALQAGDLQWLEQRLGASLTLLGHATDGAVRLRIAGPPSAAIADDILRRARELPGVLYADMTKSSAAGLDRASGQKGATLPPGQAEPSTSRFVVRLRERAVDAKAGADRAKAMVPALEGAGGLALSLVRAMDADTVIVAARAPLAQSAAREIAARLSALPEVAFAEPDERVFATLLTASDPLAAEQWNLIGSSGINMQTAWSTTTGNPGVVVAVVDTGRLSHPDLANRVIVNGFGFVTVAPGERASDPRDPGGYDDLCTDPGESRTTSWHGTRVAGVLAAAANNNAGIAGVNWVSKILPVRAVGPCGGYQSDVADAIKWAAGIAVDGAFDNATPAKVINISLGGSSATCPAVYQDAINGALARGAVVVVAAGNGVGGAGVDASTFTPANCSGVITVGATDVNGNLTAYSNRGAAVDLTAPGGVCPQFGSCTSDGIRSTSNDGMASASANYTYVNDAGTSYAAPHVAGAASLLLSVKSLAPFQVQSLLESTAGASTPGCTGCARGRIDVGAALAAVALVTPSQVGSLDAQFSNGGSRVLPIPSGFDTVVAPVTNPVVRSDDSFLVAYAVRRNSDGTQHVAVARVLSDGTLDPGFGPAATSGVRVHDMSAICGGSGKSHPEALLLLAGDKFLVSANTTPRAGLCVARFNADGTHDAGFGTLGAAKASYAGDSFTAPGGSHLAVDAANGKIYALRRSCMTGGLPLARFTSGGAADAWGTSGVLMLSIPGGDCGTTAGIEMALQSDASFLVAGHFGGDAENFDGVWLRRYSAGGALDASFAGGTGRFAFLSATARANSYFKSHLLSVHASGIYLLMGAADSMTHLGSATATSPVSKSATTVRVTAAGGLDGSFGAGGWRLLDLVDPRPDANGPFDAAAGLLVQSDGKVLGVGRKQAFRLNANGSHDTTFGMNGRIVLDIGSFSNATQAFLRSTGGRMTVAGTLTGVAPNLRAYVARFVTGELTASTGCYDLGASQCTSGTLGLGGRVVGTESATPGSVTFRNQGATAITISRVYEQGQWKLPVVSDNAPGEFTWVNDTCPLAVLPAGMSCNIFINFVPTAPGERTGTLYINTDSAQGNFSVPLKGSGVGPVTLSVALTGSGAGKVSSSDTGIDCGADCSQAYPAGTVVTLTATPAAGSTFSGWSGACSGMAACTPTMDANKSVTASFSSSATGLGTAPTLQASTTFSNGNAADQHASGISIFGGALYLSGREFAAGETEGLVARYALPLAGGAAPAWKATWPGLSGLDQFAGVAAMADGVYVAGDGSVRTSDPIGAKENKGLVVKYPLSGPPGGGFAGATWDSQVPPPPGAFAFGATELLSGIAAATEAGQGFVYATGFGQAAFGNFCRLFLSKLNAAGTVLWTRTDEPEMVGVGCTAGNAVATLNGAAYAAGASTDDGSLRPMLRKYDASGTLVWVRKTVNLVGMYRGVTVFGNAIYAVGSTGQGDSPSNDFLVEKWDESGNRIWSRSYDRAASEDILRSVVGIGGSLYAVGSTRGTTGGGADVIVLELDPQTGNLLTSTLYGGTLDDIATGAATDGTDLYVVGETRSFGASGADILVLRFALTGADTTPNAFAFVDHTGVAPNTPIVSNSITVTGINAPAAISVSGGSFSVDNGPFVGGPATVTNGQTVRVQHTSAAGSGATNNTTLTIGGVSDTFTTTTVVANDTTPDPFGFVAQAGVAAATLVTSNAIVVSGITAPSPISVSGQGASAYSVNGGAFTSAAGTVTNGQSVRVRHTSGTGSAEVVNTTLTIGGLSGSFSSVTIDAGAGSIALHSTRLFGAAFDDRFFGVAFSGGAVFVAGARSDAGGDVEGLVARYALPLAAGAAPTWTTTWPGAYGLDEFFALTATSEGVYAAGHGSGRVTDTTGLKENKGAVVKLPLSGPPGGGFGGTTWDRQTPAPPGAFAYGGSESLRAIVASVESGQTYTYAAGFGQASNDNFCRFFLSKLDAAGTVLWTRTDLSEMVGIGCTAGNGVVLLNGFVYAAGGSHDDGTLRPMLRKYDTAGNLVWVRKPTDLLGNYNAVTAFGGAIYAVGWTGEGLSAASDLLVEKWDESGNRVWSRTFDRGGAQDQLNGVVGARASVFAVGQTRGLSNGGFDAILLEIDPAGGNLRKSTLYGGVQDDMAYAVATDGDSLYVAGETRSFGAGGADAFLLRYTFTGGPMAPAAVDFGGQSMGTTSAASTVVFTNNSGASVTVSSVAVTDPQFAQTNNCAVLAAGASCTIQVTFSPATTASPLNATAAASGALLVTSNLAGSPHATALAGLGEKSLVTHYYRSILRRPPDAGGKVFWSAEAARAAGLGLNVNETWFAMAQSFYFSAEYAAFNSSNAAFVTDLYNTFFNRAPDSGGFNFWVSNLNQGMPREVALASFMFSAEFRNFTQAIYGNTAARAEVDAVVDFYRGLLARLPDDDGFNFWVGKFRTAQCQGAAAITAQVEAISQAYTDSGEYAARGRTNAQYVGDLYNAFLRRGGDLDGVLFWISTLTRTTPPPITRDQLRQEFKVSPEFQARVNAIIAQGCLQ